MRTRRTTRGLLSVALCTLALGSYAWAGGGFLDDFSDGSIQDGSPVTWRWDASMGTCVVTPEGLRMTAPTGWGESLYVFAQGAYGSDVRYTGNVTVRVRVKVPESTEGFGSQAFVCLRTGDAAGGGYMLAINRLYFHIQRLDGYHYSNWYSPSQWDSAMNGRFDSAQDVMIQFDVIDLTDAAGHRTTSRLEGRWWLPGQEMPAQPQVSATDAKFDAGGIAIGNGCIDGLNSGVIFRWVEVIGTQIEIVPLVDFNGDGTVDINDLLRLIESWGHPNSMVDVVPDGVVDKKDLEALMNCWQQDVNDPTLRAHWALDETEGNVAYDSVGLTHGTVLGDAVCRPDAGQLEGALEFDGVDDVVTAGAVVNPSNGPFSVLAWVKGGAPGQVIFSQASGANWLMADASQGLLKTELRSAGRFAKVLCSQATITDGDWHRVALVCDGSNRILYVDGVAAAQDVQTNLVVASGNLLIGAGSTLAPGTFWSGLIDDVRIYDRTVKP
ncbi:MAG: LamG domain-containing protein [Sedimentisphaerales bacterium]|nr:LamG domain-containing protein [Sedimentisphaerales bacterium]